jgi:hypothetical protein
VTAVVWRAVATAVAVALLAAIAAQQGPALPIIPVAVAAALLIPLAGIAWWAVALAAYAWRRHRDSEPMLSELDSLMRTATAATVMAGLGLNFLLGNRLPRGAGIVLLLAGVLLYEFRPISFVIRFYRRR